VLAKLELEISGPYLTLCLLGFHAIELSPLHITELVFNIPCILIGRKWVDLVSRSTITQMAFFSEAERGNPMMKSIEIEFYFQWVFIRVLVHLPIVDAHP